MKYSTPVSMAAALFAAGTSAQQQTIQPAVNCRNEICYSMTVPQTTASNGRGNIYFQMYAPDTFSWVGMGTGSMMADSNMFIMYQDGSGNVTVSPRQASGRTMPTVPPNAPQLTLLEGSGVSNGFMTANVRCANCTVWKQTQRLNVTAEAPMIGAWSEGDPLNDTRINAPIGVHTGSPRIFSLDLSTARMANDANPFVGELAVPAEAANSTDDGDDDDDDDETEESAGSGYVSLLSSGLVLAAGLAGVQLLAL